MSAKSALSPDLPWPGAAPYATADRTYFHGRKRETEELLRLIQRDVLTLVTGARGIGKTSLIQAGLIPALTESEWMPVIPKLDWSATSPKSTAPDLDPDVVVSLGNPLSQKLIESLIVVATERNFSSPAPEPGETLWEYFHRAGNRWWSSRQRVVTPIIIIDEFESVFTTATQNATAERHADGFLKELSQLAANRPPQRLATRLDNGSVSEAAYDFEPVPIRIVLIMRDEFAPEITSLRPLFPTLRRSELRMEPFTTSQARDVLMRGSLQASLMSDKTLDAIVAHLTSDRPSASEILPGKLSVLAQSLALARKERGVPQITPEFLPNSHAPAAILAKEPVSPAVATNDVREELAASERRRRGNQRLAAAAILTALIAVAAPVVQKRFLSPRAVVSDAATASSHVEPEIPASIPAISPDPVDPAAFERSFSIATPEFLPSAPPTPAAPLAHGAPELTPKPLTEPVLEELPLPPEQPVQPAESESASHAVAAKPRAPSPSALSPDAQRQLNAAAADRKEQQKRREFLRRQQEGRRSKETAPR